jgi:hypothetical protein
MFFPQVVGPSSPKFLERIDNWAIHPNARADTLNPLKLEPQATNPALITFKSR